MHFLYLVLLLQQVYITGRLDQLSAVDIERVEGLTCRCMVSKPTTIYFECLAPMYSYVTDIFLWRAAPINLMSCDCGQ